MELIWTKLGHCQSQIIHSTVTFLKVSKASRFSLTKYTHLCSFNPGVRALKLLWRDINWNLAVFHKYNWLQWSWVKHIAFVQRMGVDHFCPIHQLFPSQALLALPIFPGRRLHGLFGKERQSRIKGKSEAWWERDEMELNLLWLHVYAGTSW